MDAGGKCTWFHGSQMHLLRLLPLLLLFLSLSISVQAQEEDKSMSWLASGESTASFEIESSGFTLTLDGTHQEIAFFQDRSPFTNLFTGLHLISLDYSGEGTDNSGNKHVLGYENISAFFSLGYDWYLAEFAHLQPYLAYGGGLSSHSATHTASDGTQTPYKKQSQTSDIGIYGVNLILELTGKLWLGYALNYFVESQTIKYDDSNATIAPVQSQTLMLVWSWERVPIKAIDPKASFFSF